MIKSLMLAAVACLGLSSCGDFLAIEPKTFVSEDNFWNEKTDIDQMVTGVYVKMQSDAVIRRCIVWGEVRSDNIGDGLKTSEYTDLYRTLKEYLLSTNTFTSWYDFYSVINQCNIIIARAPEVSKIDPVYTQSDVNATIAEMSFLRDLCYFYLVRAFKDVPYYTNPVQSDEDATPIAATDGDVIVRALIADLESVVTSALKAYPKDTGRYYNSTVNRVTQNAIYALLADLCLWDNQYQKCIDYSQKVIDAKLAEYKEDYAGKSTSTSTGNLTLYKWSEDTGDGYPLYPCYSGNEFGNDFNTIFSSTGNSFESLFELAFTYDGSDNRYVRNTACAALYGNHYLSGGNDGQGYLGVYESVSSSPKTSQTVFDHDHDCRYYANIGVSGSGTSTKAYTNKFVAEEVSIESVTGKELPFEATVYSVSGDYDNHNWIFYRLTDVMLMQAEALIEKAQYDRQDPRDNNGTQLTDGSGNKIYDEDLRKAFGLIYAVNRRSYMTNSATTTPTGVLKISDAPTRIQLRELCMKERRRELMFEGKRWFDLLRRCHREGTPDYIKSAVPAKSGGTTPVNYEAFFWPYNKTELKCNSLLEQKAYYGDSDDEGSFKSTN
ncbi:MAG: RagB/SusD family nutrient uptake outer membrane protein [Bacteroidaceae bacterium]|nr:RagB/SusD family nutrient uptake outer membrane protein [Bacteroidaceae bacterium]